MSVKFVVLRSGIWRFGGVASKFSRRPLHWQRAEGSLRSNPLPPFSNIAQSSYVSPSIMLARHLSTSLPFNQSEAAATALSSSSSASAESAISGVSVSSLETSAHQQWATDAAQTLAEGETFASLGLGGYSPVGVIQSSMELIYNATGLPWWATIVAATLCIRTLLIPVSLYLQRSSIKMNNVRPLVEDFQEKQRLYMLAGDVEMANHERNKMNAVYREHGIRPVMAIVPAIFQGAVMISFFLALRRMANAPVTSMMAGGALWFPDLTAADPSFMLPIFSCAAFLISLELGGDAGVSNPQFEKNKIWLRSFAILMIIATIKFPSCVFMYWLPSTAFSICHSAILRIPAMRSAVGLTDRRVVDTKKENISMLESWKAKKVVKDKQYEQQQAKKRYKKQMENKKPVLYSKNPKKK